MTKKTKKPLNIHEKKLKKIIQQLSGDVENIDGELVEPLIIRGSGSIYCYNPNTREFVYVFRGTAVYLITELKDDKFLIYTTTGYVLEIETQELIDIGFD